MNKDQKDAIDVISDSIISTCRKVLDNAAYDKTYAASVIKSNDGKNDFYDVMVEGEIRAIKNATPMTFDPSCPVWCTAPMGDLSKMFISGRR